MGDVVLLDGDRANLPVPSEKQIELNAGEFQKRFLEDFLLSQNKNKINSFAYSLVKIPWAVFGALTWRSDLKATSHTLRIKDFYFLIRIACVKYNIRPRNLLIYAKSEWGYGKRGHLHFIIGKQGLENVNVQDFCNTLVNLWRKDLVLFFNGERVRNIGTASIVPFDEHQQLKGVLYQSKIQYDKNDLDFCVQDEFSEGLKRFLGKKI